MGAEEIRRSAVVVLVGLPGAGKTTAARSVQAAAARRTPPLAVDVVHYDSELPEWCVGSSLSTDGPRPNADNSPTRRSRAGVPAGRRLHRWRGLCRTSASKRRAAPCWAA